MKRKERWEIVSPCVCVCVKKEREDSFISSTNDDQKIQGFFPPPSSYFSERERAARGGIRIVFFHTHSVFTNHSKEVSQHEICF